METNPNPKTYRANPQAIWRSKAMKEILRNYKHGNITLAESTRNSKINHIRTRKTNTEWSKKGNLILISRCVCGEKHKIAHTKFRENGEQAHERIHTTVTKCSCMCASVCVGIMLKVSSFLCSFELSK